MQTTSLNGTWTVTFDPKNEGKKKNYQKKALKGSSIAVPGVWELVKPGYDGAGWYSRTFDLPTSAKGQVVRIRFGAVNYFCEVWVNGEYAGSHEGGYTPFVLDITDKVIAKKNKVVVRVVDPPRDRAVDGFVSSAPLRQTDIPTWKAGWYHNFGGIWQDVDLLVSGNTFIDDIFVQASCVRKKITADVAIVNKGKARAVEFVVTARQHKGGGAALFTDKRTVQLEKGANTVSFSSALKDFTPWDCDNPFLYEFEAVVLEKDVEIDASIVRFGIRDFEVKGGYFLLNGKRIMLKGYLQQGVYPVTLVFPHNRQMALKEMRLLKDNGYNYIRAHLKPSPLEILDLADEMGILISAEPPMGWLIATPKAADRAEKEVREMVLRDRNRPSVVTWCLFNEILDEVTVGLRRYELMQMVHKLDPTRIVIGNSGSFSSKYGETDCFVPYEDELSQFIATGAYYGSTDESMIRYRTGGMKGIAALISEFGAMEAPMQYKEVLANYTPAQKKLGLEDYAQYKRYYDSLKDIFSKGKLQRIWKNPEAMITEIDKLRGDEVRHQVSSIRANPNWQGYAFCQLADASGEIFGATDLWRKPKRIFKNITEASKVPWVTLFVNPRTVRRGEMMTLQAWLVNEGNTGAEYDAIIEVKTKGGKTLQAFRKSVTAKEWVDPLVEETVNAPDSAGKFIVEATLSVGGKVVCKNSMAFTVLPTAVKKVDEVALLDLSGKLAPVFEAQDYKVLKTGNNYRETKRVVFFAMDENTNVLYASECLGAARRIVKAGGVLVLLEQQWPLLWQHLLGKPIRLGGAMRSCIYMQDHPIFRGLPAKGIMDYEYLPVEPKFFHDPRDIMANGGEVISGALCANIWTTPDEYYWGSCLDVIPLGEGHIITCTLGLLNSRSPIAENLLANLVNFAVSLIRPGNEEKLWAGRCVDDL